MPTFAPGSLGGPAWREEVTQLDVERQVAKLKREKSTLGKAISRADAAVKSMARKHQAVHSANALRLLTKRTKGEELLFRERIYLTVNEPSSGLIAYAFANAVKYHVILCCFAFMVESVEYVTTRTGAAIWMVLRIYFNVFFTVEATLRVAGHIPIRRSLTDPVLFLDIWSVLPFWVRLLAFPKSITPGLYLVRHSRPLTVRTFESIGMIRLLKLSSHYYGAELLAKAIGRSARELLVPAFLLAIMVLACSAVIYDIEWDQHAYECGQHWLEHGVDRLFLLKYPDGPSWGCDVCTAATSSGPSSLLADKCRTCNGYPPGYPDCAGVPFAQTFQDIPRAMWFVLVTVTTVGYGDISPRSWQGQVFTALMILCGIIFLAMPLNSVGNHFSRVWEERQLHLLKTALRVQLMHKGISPDDVYAAFHEFDRDGNGLIDAVEFSDFVTGSLKINISRPELHQLWRSLDIDGLGSIDFAEFAATCFPQSVQASADVGIRRSSFSLTDAPPEKPDPVKETKTAAPASPAPSSAPAGGKLGAAEKQLGAKVLGKFKRAKEATAQRGVQLQEAVDAILGLKEQLASVSSMKSELTALRSSVEAMDARMGQVERTCNTMGETAVALQDALRTLTASPKPRLRAQRSSLKPTDEAHADAERATDAAAAKGDAFFAIDAQEAALSASKEAPGRETTTTADTNSFTSTSSGVAAGDDSRAGSQPLVA